MKPPQKPGGLRTSSPNRGGKLGAVKTGGPKSGGARAGHRARPTSKDLGPSQRQLRAGELVRHALAEILRVEEVADPALAGVSVTVTEVRMSPDLKHAICFVEPLGAGLTGTEVDLQLAKDKAAEVVAGLNRASRHFRGILGRSVELKFTPQLRFLHDESFDAASHMNELFAHPDVARDLKPLSLDGGGVGGGGKHPEAEDDGAGGSVRTFTRNGGESTPNPGPSPLKGEGSS